VGAEPSARASTLEPDGRRSYGSGNLCIRPATADDRPTLRVNGYRRSVLIPGDLGELGWLLSAKVIQNMQADVLGASHHGREDGYPEVAS
jgi:hypothetical protein